MGLNCGKCVAKIESAFEGRQVKVTLAFGKAYCFNIDIESTKTTIHNLGFKAYLLEPHQGRVLLNVSVEILYNFVPYLIFMLKDVFK